MPLSSSERRLRAALPLIRLLNAYLPRPLTRWLIEKGVERAELPAGVRREAVSADGVQAEWLIPQRCLQDRVLCYLHGGAAPFPGGGPTWLPDQGHSRLPVQVQNPLPGGCARTAFLRQSG